MVEIKPYGDLKDDGKVQLSFTLPLPTGEQARQAALALVEKMGFERALVVHMKPMGPDFTFFIVYGATRHSIDPGALITPEREFPVLTAERANLAIRRFLKRRLVVVGACTGTDAHTVGLDAILSMKGFAGDKGLEYYNEMRVFNMGAQVEPRAVVDLVESEQVDAVLISQVVTQRDAHLRHLEAVRDALVNAGVRDRVLLVGGGPRLAPEQAGDLGYDRIFGSGTKPSEVASFLVWEIGRRLAA